MSRSADIELEFGDELRQFRLPYARLQAIQEATDAGPLELYNRLESGTWRTDELRTVIRQGLIGGGSLPFEANKTVRTYLDDTLPKVETEIDIGEEVKKARLTVADVKKIEAACNSGLPEITTSLAGANWRTERIITPITVAIEGLGLDGDLKKRVLNEYGECIPLMQLTELSYKLLEPAFIHYSTFVNICKAILLVALMGPGDERVGERKAGVAKKKSRSRATKSASQIFTD